MEIAKDQAAAQFETIKELMETLENSVDNLEEYDEAQQAIYEKPLSVEVRSGWGDPGSELETKEFRILLCTGGPAVQIVGDLNQHGEPESAALEFQDWFEPWSEYYLDGEEQELLISFCQQFYFGE